MVKFTYSDTSGQTHIGIGLTRENIRRLKQDQPIRFDLSDLQLPETDVENAKVTIFYGKTEQKIARDLKQFIGPETDVHVE